MRTLIVEDAAGDRVHARLTGGDGAPEAADIDIPLLALHRTGVDELLTSGKVSELAARAQRYASLLMGPLQRAFNADLNAAGLHIDVRTGPRVQTLVWETLRLLGDDESPVTVARSVPGAPRSDAPPARCDLVWLAARAPEDSIPRYRVAGPVLARLYQTDTITPRWVSTATSRQSLMSMPDRITPIPGCPRIVHLDVHGVTAAWQTRDGQFASGFVARFGAENVSEEELYNIILGMGCRLFVSNACHGGDQRDLSRLPFPARLVQGGAHAAVVARGPVPEPVAARFHETLYTMLALGKPLIKAHATAIQHGAGEAGNSSDRGTQAVVQPMLWLAASDDDTPMCPPTEPQVTPRVMGGVYLVAAAEDGVTAAVLKAVEGELAVGQGFPALDFGDRDVSEQARSVFTGAVRWAMGSPAENEDRRLPVPALTFEERRSIVRRLFRTTSPLADVLAIFCPGDIFSIAASATRAGGSVATALLRTAEMGSLRDNERGRAAAESVLRGYPPDELVRACLAMPILGIGPGAEIEGARIPPMLAALADDNGILRARLTHVRWGGFHFAVPDTSLRDAARALARPEVLCALRFSEHWQPLDSDGDQMMIPVSWGQSAAWACAAHLVLAIAARQAGTVDLLSLATCAVLLGNTSVAAAIELLHAVRAGLEHWPEIDSQFRADSDGFISAWEDQNRTRTALVADSGPVDAEGGHAETTPTPREHDRARAYELERAGDTAEAMRIAVAVLATASIEEPFDYCESLHLLGAINERVGRWEAAAGWLAKEREIDPPADHRRLHNREHYFALLHEHRFAPDLQFTLAAEASVIAQAMGDTAAAALAARRMITSGLEESKDDWVRQGLAEADLAEDVDPRLCSLARGYLSIDVSVPKAVEELLLAANGEGTIPAHARLLLSQIDGSNAVEHLRQGIRVRDGGSYSTLCQDTLIMRLMGTGQLDELRATVGELGDVGRSRPPVWYARAGLALLDSAPDREARLTDALTTDGGRRTGLLAGLDPRLRIRQASAVDAVQLLVSYLTDTRFLRSAELSPVAPLSAAGNLATLAKLFEPPDRRWVVGRMLHCSERAWEAGSPQNMALAAALCSHACETLKALGEHEDMVAYTHEIGWLASIERQRGRPTDAERLFQQALALAPEYLPPIEQASLTGRYGNLMHDLGEYAAAVHLQWQGVRRGMPARSLSERPSRQALQAALDNVADTTGPDRERWNTLLINLANCLADDGEPSLALLILDWMRRQPDFPGADKDVAALWQGIAHRVLGRSAHSRDDGTQDGGGG